MSFTGGWLKLWRELWLKPGLSLRPKPGEKARRMEAWLWLLAQTNHDDNLDHVPPLRAGQVAMSRGDVCAYTNWTDGEARAWLKALESEGRISRHSVGRTSVITVLNWSRFQHRNSPDPVPDECRTSAGRVPEHGQVKLPESLAKSAASAGRVPDECRTSAGLGPAITEEGRRETEEGHEQGPPTSTPAPSDPAVAGSRSRGTWTDERGHEWPHPDRLAGQYPRSFEAVWGLWLTLRQSRGSDVVKPGAKLGAYRALRSALVLGKLTAEQAYRSAKAYTAAFAPESSKRWPSPTTKHVKTFFGTDEAWREWLGQESQAVTEQHDPVPVGGGDLSHVHVPDEFMRDEFESLIFFAKLGGGPRFATWEEWAAADITTRRRALVAARDAGFYG